MRHYPISVLGSPNVTPKTSNLRETSGLLGVMGREGIV